MQASDFVQSYIAAWNLCDAEYVAQHFSKEGVYCDIPAKSRHSRDELVTVLTKFFSAQRNRYELVGDIVTNNHVIGFQYRIHSTDDAPGELYSVSRIGAEFITLHRDRAMSIEDYYDSPAAVQPSPGINIQTKRMRPAKYAKSGLKADCLARHKSRLESTMTEMRVFEQPNLTLPKLAARMGCTVNHLSQVINAGFGMSFFDYVNYHRVEYAMMLLSQKGAADKSMECIAHEVGFNSRSVFFASFKKFVGQSPSQFRQSRQLN